MKTNETEIIYTFKNSHILSSAKDFDEHKPVYQFCVSWLLFRSEIEDIFAPSPSPASLKYVFKRADDKFTALYKTTFKNSQISSTQNLLLYMKQRKKKKKQFVQHYTYFFNGFFQHEIAGHFSDIIARYINQCFASRAAAEFLSFEFSNYDQVQITTKMSSVWCLEKL